MASKKKKKNRNGVSNFFAVVISIAAVFVFTAAIVFGFVGINAISFINN